MSSTVDGADRVGAVGEHDEGAGAALDVELGEAELDAVEERGLAGGDEAVDRRRGSRHGRR